MSDYKSFHFDLGDSASGPIGYCARVVARTEDEAVAVLRAALPDHVEVGAVELPDRIGYIAAYFNRDAVARGHIDAVEDANEDELASLGEARGATIPSAASRPAAATPSRRAP